MNWKLAQKQYNAPVKDMGVSETVQEPGYSVRQLVDKFTKSGAVPNGFRKTYFMQDVGFDDQDWDEFNRLDIQEQSRIAQEAKQLLDEYEQREEQMAEQKRQDQEALAKSMSAPGKPQAEEPETDTED